MDRRVGVFLWLRIRLTALLVVKNGLLFFALDTEDDDDDSPR